MRFVSNVSVYFTAAHCIKPKFTDETLLARDVLAFFGAHDLENYKEPGRFLLTPRMIHVHDHWNPGTSQYEADLSLLEFEKGAIYLNNFVQPICLWFTDNQQSGTVGIVTGWGKSQDGTKIHENEPKLIKVLIQDNNECLPGEPLLASLASSRTFCAGLKNASGVCHGDSGGGLSIQIERIYYIKGIVSSSLTDQGQCDISKNAIYTNVPMYRDWIENKIGGEATWNLVSLFSYSIFLCSCCGKYRGSD